MVLPIYQIEISNTEYRKLKSNVWSDHFVSAKLHAGGATQLIRIRYRGGHNREYIKKSYEIRTAHRTVHFNAEYDDPSLIRNALSFHFFNSIGVPAPATKHCVLSINGQLEGVYLQIEGVKEGFFRKKGIPVRSIFYAVNDHADFSNKTSKRRAGHSKKLSGYLLVKGVERDWFRLNHFVTQLNMQKGKDLFTLIHKHIDIHNYLHWLSGAVLTGNMDGFNQNYTLYEHKTRMKYGILPWGYEGTWGRNCYGQKVDHSLVRIKGYNVLTRKMMNFKHIRSKYREILSQIVRTQFTLSKIMPVVYRMHQDIRRDVFKDPYYKWPFEVFINEPDTIYEYIEKRRQQIIEEIKEL